MPHHHVQHTPNVGPILFMPNENIAHVMPHVSRNAVTSCTHRAARTRRHASHPNYMWCARNYLWFMTFAQAELYLTKLTASHFSTLNTKIANQNVLKRVLIAMLNENTAKSNENFMGGAEESVPPLYNW